MNVFVTGATGFIGGAVVKKLIENSYHVKILVRRKYKSKIPEGIKVYKGDLRDYNSINKAFSNTDIVINCAAALPHHKLAEKDYRDINVLGVQNIINACISNGVKRLIHISTVGIYGPTLNKHISEKSVPNPEDIYSRSKLDGEIVIKNSSFRSSSIIIRPTICYGPGDIRPVFLRLFRMINRGFNISIGDGNNYLHTVYIDNVVNVILKTVKQKSILGKDFIIGDLVCPRMKDIVKEIAQIQNKKYVNITVPTKLALIMGKIVGIERTVKFVSENRKYLINKSKKCFNLKSDVGVSDGIAQTYKWYKRNNLI